MATITLFRGSEGINNPERLIWFVDFESNGGDSFSRPVLAENGGGENFPVHLNEAAANEGGSIYHVEQGDRSRDRFLAFHAKATLLWHFRQKGWDALIEQAKTANYLIEDATGDTRRWGKQFRKFVWEENQ